MAVFTDAEHPYPDGVLPHLVRIFTTDHTRQFLKYQPDCCTQPG
ncbi:hypothetical protein AB9K36_02400 [Klebsiella michiganensis]